MDYQLNPKNIPSTSSSPLTIKRSFHGRKLQYQERIFEPASVPGPATTVSPTYLTADSAWKTVSNIVASKRGMGQRRQVERG